MRAVVFDRPGRVRVASVPEPRLTHPEDAIVRVRRAAICGTDLHVVAHPEQVAEGTVLGHEFVGEIVETGAAVTTHAVGDLVVGADYTACGRCWWCRRGDHWECPERQFFGTGAAFGPPLPGSQAELVRVPHADVVLRPVPAGVGLDAAVFLGDVLATGYAAVRRAGYLPGDTVAVVGGGPVGQLTSLVAQACGAGPVVLVEPVESRRRLAGEQGALVTGPEQARDLVDGLTEGRGADAVIDAVGGPVGLGTALRLVRSRGSVVSVGVSPVPTWELPLAQAFTAELSVRFAIGDLMRDADQLTTLVRSGIVDPTVVVSDVVALEAVPDAYAGMADRRSLKTVISM